VFVLLRTFEQLADIFVTAIVPFYALAVASIFVLRGAGLRPPFRTPGYPVVPALFILATLFLLGNAISIRRAAGGRSLCSASSWAGSGCTISPSTRGTSTRIAQRDVRTPAHSIPVLLRGSARS
jgi:hypothetical protein